MGALAKLTVDESVLPGQRLDILRQLSHFLSFELGNLGLLVDSLPQAGAFLPQRLDLLFTLEKLSLIVVFFADLDAHLVLDITELEALVLELLLSGH